MEEEPTVLQCQICGWWSYFWEERPTIPFTCDYCKIGEPPWETRRPTPEYGTPIHLTLPYGVVEFKKK